MMAPGLEHTAGLDEGRAGKSEAGDEEADGAGVGCTAMTVAEAAADAGALATPPSSIAGARLGETTAATFRCLVLSLRFSLHALQHDVLAHTAAAIMSPTPPTSENVSTQMNLVVT